MGIFHIPPPRKWNHRHITLATLTGCLVFITIAAITSIVLSPGHISFAITKPTSVNETDDQGDAGDTKRYVFILVANNTSTRMAAVYGALSAEIWYSDTAWVPALPDDQRSLLQNRTTRQKPTSIKFSAEYWQSEQRSPPSSSGGMQGGGHRGESAPAPPAADASETEWSNCTVLVTATVQFKYGRWISTRSYDVLANCSPVNFTGSGDGISVPCKQG